MVILCEADLGIRSSTCPRRGEDREGSDLDILVEASPGTSLYDLADIEIELEKLLGCKVEMMTKGFLTPDVAKRIETDLVPLQDCPHRTWTFQPERPLRANCPGFAARLDDVTYQGE